MGIQNLLKFMKPFIEPIHIKKYAGKRVGIDAYSWLHKGAYSCSMELCLDSKSDKKTQYLHYFMHRINLLLHYEIIPVVVFDGGNIPCKSATESERRRKRESNLASARLKLHEGDVSGAIEFFQRAVSITPSMAHHLIQILRSKKIEFIVAPYEADAQLAYLSSLKTEQGGIAAVITEDSDLVAYGCPAIVFKMDRYGNGDELLLHKVFNSGARVPSFRTFNEELFKCMCVLAGCDFLPSIPGIGIVRAHSIVSKYRNVERVLSVLKFEKGNQMPEDYSKSFREAVAVFKHARIYDAESKRLKHMNPLPQKLLETLDGELDFLGLEIPPTIAAAIAEGHLDPISMEAFDHFSNSESYVDHAIVGTSDQQMTAEAQVLPTQESCFTIFSSHETREERIKVAEQRPISYEIRNLKEAAALEQLIMPLECSQKSDPVPEKIQFPDNNPFKKRKIDHIHMDQRESIVEQVSEVTHVEISEQKEFHDNNEFMKGKFVRLDQGESIAEQVSEVINVEKSDDVLCMSVESQESVESKPTKVIKSKGRMKNEKKLINKNSCKSSESRKSTILNFFTRL